MVGNLGHRLADSKGAVGHDSEDPFFQTCGLYFHRMELARRSYSVELSGNSASRLLIWSRKHLTHCNSNQLVGGNMPDQGLKELYIDELKDLYSAENQLVKALPKMAKAASSEELREGFEKHLEQTKGHVQRLEQIFQMLGESPRGKTCKGMQGLIEEGSEAAEEDYEGSVMDAALIGAAQRVEHYEIAGYGTVRSMAKTLGAEAQATLLEETLEEEKETDEKLTELGEQINTQANESGDERQDEASSRDKKKSKRVA